MENDKFIISEFYTFKPDVRLIREAERDNQPITLSGILQKANTLNRNGRVYPYNILKREATKYMELVDEGRALGECVPKDTEIFTKDGWKNIQDVKIGDEIFTLNVENLDLEIQKVEGTIQKKYNDQIVHIYDGKSINMLITKRHKVILWNEHNQSYILTGEELFEKIKNNDEDIFNSYLKASEITVGVEYKYVTEDIILSPEFLKAELIDFNDEVYCVSIPNKTWLMKNNANVCWSHNCDHPDCKTADSKILTKEGWKFLPDISEDEEILTLNLETKKVEIQKIDKKIDQYYKGDMYHISGRGIDTITTPNHRFLVKDKNDQLIYLTAEQLVDVNKRFLKLLKKADWEGMDYETIKINAVPEQDIFKGIRKDLMVKYTRDLYLNAEWFYKFLGFYLSEGNVFGTKGGKGGGYEIQITQKDQEKVKKIREILDNLSPELCWREIIQKTGTIRFQVNDARLHKYLFKLGNSCQKYIPFEIKQGSSKLLKMLFDNFLLGDGRRVRRNYRKNKEDDGLKKESVFTVSKQLIEDLQEILVKTGGCGNITTFQPKDRYINDIIFSEEGVDNGDGTLSLVKIQTKRKRLIKAENSKVQYFLNISSTEYTGLDSVKIEKIPFEGNVYCVRVKNGNFYTMRNGMPFWTGNSAVVSLQSASHKVIDMWWQGEELYGKIELLDEDCTPSRTLRGLLKSNVMLGISSRGVGSVKSVRGEDIVQDDFELIAFDFVSSPSTPGAFLFKEGKQWGLTPISEEKWKKIKCENGVCRVITEESSKNFNSLNYLSNKEFWKKNNKIL